MGAARRSGAPRASGQASWVWDPSPSQRRDEGAWTRWVGKMTHDLEVELMDLIEWERADRKRKKWRGTSRFFCLINGVPQSGKDCGSDSAFWGEVSRGFSLVCDAHQASKWRH